MVRTNTWSHADLVAVRDSCPLHFIVARHCWTSDEHCSGVIVTLSSKGTINHGLPLQLLCLQQQMRRPSEAQSAVLRYPSSWSIPSRRLRMAGPDTVWPVKITNVLSKPLQVESHTLRMEDKHWNQSHKFGLLVQADASCWPVKAESTEHLWKPAGI